MRYKKRINQTKSKILIASFLFLIIVTFITTYTLTYSEYTTATTLSEVENASGVFDNIVVVDDFSSDYNYYMGLNYTNSSDGTLPSGVDQNLYNDSNLVKTIIHYSGRDLNDNSLVGYVSLNERQDTYTYYKYYPVKDGYITIELIDNPFTDRPTDKGFNGWITDYQGVTISYDSNYYIRYAKVPVTITDNKPDQIEITFHANWYNASVGRITSTANQWSSVFSNLKTGEMQQIGGTITIYEDVTQFYTQGTITRWDYYPSGAVNASGNSLTGWCNSRNGCTYYMQVTDNVYNPDVTYYELTGNGNNRRMTQHTVTVIGTEEVPGLDAGIKLAGFYREVNVSDGTGYYDNNGVLQTSRNCTSGTCTYYELVQYYDASGNIEESVEDETYYYLATRDTNIIVMTSNTSSTWTSSQNKPFTLTSLHNGVKYNVTWTVSKTAVTCYNDTAIENLTINSNQSSNGNSPTDATGTTRYLYANYNNVKVGRGIVQSSTYKNFNGIIGGDNSTSSMGSSSNTIKYKLIVESGFYNTITLTNGPAYGTANKYVEAIGLYGNDYDKVTKDNTNLDVNYDANGSWGGGNYYSSSLTTGITFDTIVRSGSFGTGKYDHITGIYVGGRSYGTHYTARRIKVEGGWIYNLIGGPLTGSNRGNINDTYMYITGGEVDMIVGGAGTSATYGNRIISVTDGTVNYSVFGGSNGYDGSNTDGTLNGSSFIYIGGNATIGNPDYVNNNITLWGAEAGSVFGIGNGKEGTSSIGSNDNSNIIVDGNATILNNVYGGGNFGATGISSSSNTNTTNITINGGTINGSVYGGGNNNGAGSNTKTSTINIKMTNGTILGSVYGGSKNKGTVYGNVNLDIQKGTVQTSVYGGGEGGYASNNEPGTFVTGAVQVNIGEINQENNLLNINTSVYGGSAFGTVNGSTQTTNVSSSNTNVVVNSGTIKNVFGGGEGNDTYTPYVEGNVTVDIHGGIIENVFGGNDLKGTPNGSVTVNINGGEIQNAYAGGNQTEVESPYINLLGGTIENAFGGGNNAKVTTSNVLLDGATATNVFGGSNASGDVTTSNVIANSGTATNIFGGNNIGGTTATTNVTINGGTIQNAYGGGEQTDVTDATNITLNARVTNLFGGSDSAGTVKTSYVNVFDGIATNIYGGNNLGGTTTTSNVTITGGIINNVYGGGLQASTTASNVNLIYGKVDNLFGGGSKAGVETTHVNLNKGYVKNTFGGSNTSGNVTTSNIKNITNNLTTSNVSATTTVTTSTINQTGATDIKSSETLKVTINNGESANITKWDFYLVTTESIFDSNWSGTTVEEINGVFHANEINQWYGTNPISAGGSHSFEFNIHSYVEYEEFKVCGYVFIGYDDNGNQYKTVGYDDLYATSIFGGNNEGGITDSSNINLTNGNIDSVYGGGEKATTNTPQVVIDGATINKVVYGGGDQAPITNDTLVDIKNNASILGNVYGGGNEGIVNGKTTVNVTASTISLNIYGGGNKAKVVGNTLVTSTNSTILNNIYGGGNEAAIEGNTNVKVIESNISYNVFGGGNNGQVFKNASTTITNSTIGESAYAGGNGSTATVVGNNLINVEGTTSIVKHLFGGGNAAETGCATDIKDSNGTTIMTCASPNTSKSEVNVAGATIGGNVYGGANTSVVYGETFVNIGVDTIDPSYNLTKGNIQITGTIFGGGEANASGSEDYDFKFISVTKGINIHMDATDHDIYQIDGSIFGSGNASSSGGYSYINIDNYGTPEDYKNNISIQRADIVTLNNSAIELAGAKDRTNKYESELFTLSRIGELKLKNGSTLYLDKGANLLEKFSSLADVGNTETEVTVDIDKDAGTVTKTADNRIYMYEGKNLNISDDESLATYGEVNGMTFFGMFTKDRNGRVATALYSPNYDYGDAVSGSELYYFSSGSYVVGEHKTDHDITKDGFYTNYASEDGTSITVDYIEPTPSDAIYYRWVVGESVEVLEVSLTASKYSTLGTYELQLLNFYHPNTEIDVLGVNYDNLSSDINLLQESDIPRHADTAEEANTNFGLSMKSGTTGWITKGDTEFLTVGDKDIKGTTIYKAENSNAIPSLVFYLYHSKNLSETKDLGSVTISLMVVTPIDDLSNKIQRINIEVSMDSALYDGDNYEAAITPGAKYEMFANSNVNITSKSTFSSYYSLYINKDTNPYKEGYYRSLVSSYAMPANTKITMIDFASSDKPEYYYYVISGSDYQQSVTELATEGEVSYPLSRFIRMGSSSTNNTYSDTTANTKYYDSENQKAEEEFVFIVDFKESNIDTDVLRKSLLIELRAANDNPVIPVLDIEQQKMIYNLYADKDAIINATAELSKKSIYVGNSVDLTVVTDFAQQKIGGTNIIDTNFYDKKLGIKLSFYDEEDNLVNGASLLGTRFIYEDASYFPRQDGTVRFNIAESVANVSSKITIDTTNSNIASGIYKLVIETFGSSDGIYYGLESSATIEKEITIINDIFGLSAEMYESDVIIDKDTGLSEDKNNYVEFRFAYSSGLTKPNIRVSLYRRTYTDIYNYTYNLVDLQDYVTNELTTTNNNNEYLVMNSPSSSFQYILNMKENLKTGTYQVKFSLYDEDNYVGSIDKYIIIK